MIINRIDIDALEVKEVMPPFFYSALGYGRKIPTHRMVRLPGDKRWRRVYCCCYSNTGTCYVVKGKDWIVLY